MLLKFKIDQQKIKEAHSLLRRLLEDDNLMQILILLSEHEILYVTKLYNKLNIQQPVVSLALIKLRYHGLVNFQRQNRNIFYSLSDKAIKVFEVVKAFNKNYIKGDGIF